jgi:hypothetical protein
MTGADAAAGLAVSVCGGAAPTSGESAKDSLAEATMDLVPAETTRTTTALQSTLMLPPTPTPPPPYLSLSVQEEGHSGGAAAARGDHSIHWQLPFPGNAAAVAVEAGSVNTR